MVKHSLILKYVSDYLDDLSVAKPLKKINGYTVYEIDSILAIDTVLKNLSTDNKLKNSIIKDKENWKIKLYTNQDYIPIPTDDKFYVAYDDDLILLETEDSNYFKSIEEIEDYISNLYSKNTMECTITYNYLEPEIENDGTTSMVEQSRDIEYNSKEFYNDPVHKAFDEFINKNHILINGSSVLVDCEQDNNGNYIFNTFRVYDGQIISGDFSSVQEFYAQNCIIRNGIFKELDLTDNAIIKYAKVNIWLSTGIISNENENSPYIYGGDYNIGDISSGYIYGGNFNTLVCSGKFAKLYNCNINNFILAYLPQNLNEFKGNINNIIVLPSTAQLLKTNSKLLEKSNHIYLYNTKITPNNIGELIPYKIDTILNNLTPLNKKTLKPIEKKPIENNKKKLINNLYL